MAASVRGRAATQEGQRDRCPSAWVSSIVPLCRAGVGQAAANDILRPDEDMADALRALSAALNRVGNNVNQVARRLNEAKLKGARLPYTPAIR